MKLSKALRNLKEIENVKLEDLEVGSVKINPVNVQKGDIFVCLKNGEEGRKLIEEAKRKNPSVIISEFERSGKNGIVVKDARKAFALIAKGLNDNICDRMKLVAVTGTNGKTTTTKILADILKFAGKKVGTIGTLGSKFESQTIDTGFTTPDPDILHGQLYLMAKKGTKYVVMEASAHAIELRKLEGLKFEASVLTNVTQDHLDFFGSMENYFNAKAKLFTTHYTKNAIICGDDDKCKALTQRLKIPYLTYGFKENNDVAIKNFMQNGYGMSFVCQPLDKEIEIKSEIVGDYNAQNLLAAVVVARYLGVEEDVIQNAVKNISPAEGRFNIIPYKNSNIVIDFAHTPDGLEKILKSARKITKNKLICVFGCGGNRDNLKRPIMGKIASGLADLVILTSDNPRFEKPEEIISQIERGVVGKYQKIVTRSEAIKFALNECKEGDTVVIAGKGAEKYQDIEGVKHPYSDFDVVEKIIGGGKEKK